MQEITFYGRGGQGVVIASVILANAAFKEGKFVQAFPFYGVERRGAPVWAYTRIDTVPIRAKGQITAPGFVVILDPYLVEAMDVTAGLKRRGIILINSPKKPVDFAFDGVFRVFTCDASAIALKYGLGTAVAPITNTAILGAFARATGIIKLDSLISVLPEKIPLKVENNVKAAEEAYEKAAV